MLRDKKTKEKCKLKNARFFIYLKFHIYYNCKIYRQEESEMKKKTLKL